MSDPVIKVGGAELPADNVGELGWKFVHRFPVKVRCRRCEKKRYRGVVSHTANPRDPNVAMICFECYKDLDNGPREGVDYENHD